MRVLHLITARGGSKSVPGKNLRKINNISLVGFKAISAQRSRDCTRIIISTDSQEIQADALTYGVEAPFIRPAELATDTATSVDVIVHAMEWIEQNTEGQYEAVMLLEPSSPLTRPFDYDNAVDIMEKYKANAVVGIRETEINSVFVGPIDDKGRITQIVNQIKGISNPRRQEMGQEFTANGGLYLFRWDYFKKHRDIYHDPYGTFGYAMDRHYSVEIDEPIDLQWVEFLVANGHVDFSYWH